MADRTHTPVTGSIFPDSAPDQIVYVREVRAGELPDSITPPRAGARIFAIHDSNGARLALTDDRSLAFRLAREHDRTPLSVH